MSTEFNVGDRVIGTAYPFEGREYIIIDVARNFAGDQLVKVVSNLWCEAKLFELATEKVSIFVLGEE